MVDDLRTCTVNGAPVCVFIKRRPLAKRFQNTNSEVLSGDLKAGDLVILNPPTSTAGLAGFGQTTGGGRGFRRLLRGG